MCWIGTPLEVGGGSPLWRGGGACSGSGCDGGMWAAAAEDAAVHGMDFAGGGWNAPGPAA